MGIYSFELDDELVAELKQYVLKKHGKLYGRLSKTVEKAIRQFLNGQKVKEAMANV